MKRSFVRTHQSCLIPKGVCGLLVGLLAFFLLVPHASPINASTSEISAKAAVVIDGTTERMLYAKNPHLRLAPASTTKLVTAMVVLDRVSPEAIFTVSEEAAATPSVSPRLRPRERLTVRDLLYLALMRSVNSAAVTLAEGVAGSEEAFAKMMNEKVHRLGAENTEFINASGLPGPGQSVTAYDLSRIMKASLQYPMIREIIGTRTKKVCTLAGRRLFMKNTNHLLWSDEDLLGGKTGYTREARHCFVCAADRGNTVLIAAVLGESSRDDLWEEATVLLTKGGEVLAQRAAPMIHFTSVNERRVVLASYTPENPQKKAKNNREAKTAKVKKGQKPKAAKAVAKKHHKKKRTTPVSAGKRIDRSLS